MLVLPFINEMTSSEIFSMMVCGFGSIAAPVLGALLGFGVSKNMIKNYLNHPKNVSFPLLLSILLFNKI